MRTRGRCRGNRAGGSDRTCSTAACRISRPRDAPSAVQTPNSRCRADNCASSRLLTFAHSTTNTSATPPSSSHSAWRVNGSSCHRPPAAAAADRRSWPAAAELAAEQTGRSRHRRTGYRPGDVRSRWQPPVVADGSNGLHAIVAGSGKRKPAGMTPMTVTGRPSSTMRRPTIAASAASAERHTASDRTTTASLPGRASPGTNQRPRIGCTPRSVAISVVTSAPTHAPAVASPLRNVVPCTAPTDSNMPVARQASITSGSGSLNPIDTSRSAFGNGARWNISESTTLNIAVARPMPSASSSTHWTARRRVNHESPPREAEVVGEHQFAGVFAASAAHDGRRGSARRASRTSHRDSATGAPCAVRYAVVVLSEVADRRSHVRRRQRPAADDARRFARARCGHHERPSTSWRPRCIFGRRRRQPDLTARTPSAGDLEDPLRPVASRVGDPPTSRELRKPLLFEPVERDVDRPARDVALGPRLDFVTNRGAVGVDLLFGQVQDGQQKQRFEFPSPVPAALCSTM